VDREPASFLLPGEHDSFPLVQGLFCDAGAHPCLHVMCKHGGLTEILNPPPAGAALQDPEAFVALQRVPQLAPLGGRLQTAIRRVEDERRPRMEAGEVFIHASTAKRLDQPICRLENLPL
jgi:hypothetical protein